MPAASAALLLTLGLGPLLEEADKVVVDGIAVDGETNDGALAEVRAWVEAVDEHHRATRKAEPPVVTTLQQAVANALPTVELERPVWIRHHVLPRERVSQIAVRYGVRRRELVSWNDLDPKARYPEGRRRLRVKARRLPPPRNKIRYVVQPDETWGDIAARFRVEQLDLRAYNWQRRALTPLRELTIWVDPGWPWSVSGDGPPIPETFEIPPDGLSVGRPNRGRLKNGVLLPESDLYTRRTPSHGLWGSSHTILQIHRAFAQFRHQTGHTGEIVIGALSRRRGGPFAPHVSHQSGRDIDIRLPLLPGVPPTDRPNADEIDWPATWALIQAFIDTGELAVIFLDVALHRRLYEAARMMGVRRETLAKVIKWPSWSTPGKPFIRHSKGHDTHIHVRIQCGPDEPRCRRR